jgi:catechol 2,3-dioxygenase-like lactoylglutathione lyase family enzyme
MRVAVDQVKLPVADIDRTRLFYSAALAPLGYEIVYDNGEDEVGFGNAEREPPGFIEEAVHHG